MVGSPDNEPKPTPYKRSVLGPVNGQQILVLALLLSKNHDIDTSVRQTASSAPIVSNTNFRSG